MKSIYLFCIFLFFGINNSQAQQSNFSKKIPARYNAYSVTNTHDEAYLITGRSVDFDNGLLLKLDSSGNVLWSKDATSAALNYVSLDYITSLSDSTFLVIGNGYNGVLKKEVGILIRMNLEGDTLWSRQLISDNTVVLKFCIETSDGDYLIGGEIDFKSYVARITKNGELIWSKSYAGGIMSGANSGKEVSNNHFLVTGYFNENRVEFAYVIEIDEKGTIEWSKKYNAGSNGSVGFDIEQTNKGFLFYLSSNYYVTILNCDSVGNIIWGKNYDIHIYPPYSRFRLHKNKLHSYSFVIGDAEVFYLGSSGNSIVTIDSLGQVLWSKQLDLDANDLVVTDNNKLLVIGNGAIVNAVRCEYCESYELGFIMTDSVDKTNKCAFPSNIQASKTSNIIDTAELFTVENVGMVTTISLSNSLLDLESVDGCVTLDYIGSTKSAFENSKTQLFPTIGNGQFNFILPEIATGNILLINNLNQVVYQQRFQETTQLQFNLSSLNAGLYTYKVNYTNKANETGKLIISE